MEPSQKVRSKRLSTTTKINGVILQRT